MTPLGLRDRVVELGRAAGFSGLLEALRDSRPSLQRAVGLNPAAAALHALLLQRQAARPLLVLTGTQGEADTLHRSATAWHGLLQAAEPGPAPVLLPEHDITPFDGLSPHPDISGSRSVALWRMAEGRAPFVVASVMAALQRVAPAGRYRGQAWRIREGDEVLLEILEESLGEFGYSRREPVEMVGQFAVRGGILDVFPPESARPVRVSLLGDTVESIREFDPRTQQSIRRREAVSLFSLQEYPAGGSGEGVLPAGWEFEAPGPEWRSATLLDLLPDAALLWHEPQSIRQEAERLGQRLEESAARKGGRPADFYLELDVLCLRAADRPQVAFDELGVGSSWLGQVDADWPIACQSPARFAGSVAYWIREVRARIAEGASVLVMAASPGDLERLADLAREAKLPFQLVLPDERAGLSRYLQEKARLASPVASVILMQCSVERGFALPESGFAVYGTHDLFDSSDLVPKPRQRPAATAAFLTDLDDLDEGDFVVHTEHGVGRYVGTEQVETGEQLEDFIVLEYAKGARLYVPLTRLDLIHKYHGAGGPQPRVDTMGGQTWSKTKKRVKARLLDMADDLLELYAKRKLGREFSYSPDSNWQREFEDAFPYTPTEDQVIATREIKRDMESKRIMDRLVCGDVGFGKTEVAMRAAFKALGDDKQVAVLVPTTVLAYQHLETFRQRFAPFPVEIEMLSRFRSPKRQKRIVRRLADGRIDIVIGTHRLLSKDVRFLDLGLLVIDEEQRFGVRHKERLKQARQTVDVLAMTATPIPRTLYMSLTGLRDVSIIKTPPQDRLAVQTMVAEYDEHMVLTAIRREVGRGGQVYFLHNRVESIAAVAARLAEALPSVQIRVGHGRMGEQALERVMLGFMRHEFDVLVCTTIIENGLDIPLANTLIVDRADRHGLAALYQLRGRVGRSDRRAYAYLFVPPDKELSETARKRLAALREFSELGAGFKLAALDLEIRGAGNLLGGEQSGQIAAVGIQTYTSLLNEAVRKLEGEEVSEAVRTRIQLGLDFHIPADYVTAEKQRLQLYKRLAVVRDDAERREAVAYLRDRYGSLPKPVANLLEHSVLKHRAEQLRIPLLERRGARLIVRLRADSKVDPQRLMRLVSDTPGATFGPDGTLEWGSTDLSGREVFRSIHKLLDRLVS